MPVVPPPSKGRACPAEFQLGVGSVLWRVHQRKYCPSDFKKVMSDEVFGGGRFDSTDHDPYAFLYAAPDQHTALLETLVRGIPFDETGWRRIRRVSLSGQRLSLVTTNRPLRLVALLSAADLAAVRQDEWLVQADQAAYPQTRRWAHWIRSQAEWAQGIAWLSRRNIGHQAIVLFGDRCGDGALSADSHHAVDLDDAAGADWLNSELASYRLRVSRPRAC